MLWLVTLALGWTWWQRLGLPYNEEGNYFDERSSVVLHEQAVMVYGLLALLFLGLASAATWLARR